MKLSALIITELKNLSAASRVIQSITTTLPHPTVVPPTTLPPVGVISASGPPLPNPNICLLPETIMKA